MDSSTGPSLIWGVTMVVLLIGSLSARRLPLSQIVRNLLAWIAIFVAVYGLFLYRAELRALWDRVRADLGATQTSQATGGVTELRRVDGHFYAEALVNGRPVTFLVDSGASVTTVSASTAREIGLVFDRSGFPMVVQTANGLANSWPTQGNAIGVGTTTVTDVDVHVSELADGTNLLGMNWLNRLSAWEVRGDRMILRP